MNVLPLLEILALLLPPLAFAENWSIPREYRRPIKVTSRDDTVAFSFRSGGHASPDGQDIVVADEEGKVVPSDVILSKRLGDTWVAFQASAAKGAAFVYYGGRKPVGPAPRKWQPKLSLMLVTVPLPDGALEGYASIAAATDSMARAYGLGFVPSVFHGFNPFGPSDNYASKYSGYLIIPKDGKYRIFTFSDEASFVLLDGKSVCAWPGRHGASDGSKGQHGADIQLKQGEHKIEYYHAEVDGGQSTGLGWVPPGGRYCLIPESAFVHTPVTTVGPPERQNNAPMAGFDWQRVDLVAHDKYVFARIRLTSQCQNVPANAKIVWDYGDGIKSTGMAGDHIYVAEGPFECEARILDEHGKLLDEFKLVIPADPSMGNLTVLNTKQVEEYLRVIGTYDLSKRPKEELDAYWALAEPQELPGLVRPITEAYVSRFGPKGAGWTAADRLAQAYSLTEPEKAVDLYEKLVSSAPTKPDVARIKAEQLDILINRLKRHKVASEMLKQMQKSKDELTVQLAGSKLGDIPRSQGDFEKAAEAYRDAQEKAYKDMDPREIAVREGAYLETVDGYLGSGHLRSAREMLLNWEAEYPTGKLRGDLILMTARYFQAIGDHQRALDELTTMTKLNPLSPYLPEIEWRMARAYAELGNKAKARELRDKVIREYPKSRAAAEAEKLHF